MMALNIQKLQRIQYMQSHPARGSTATVELDNAGMFLIGQHATRILMIPKAF